MVPLLFGAEYAALRASVNGFQWIPDQIPRFRDLWKSALRRNGRMDYVRLGRAGLKVSRIGLGAMGFGDRSGGHGC